jgi:hypothetical protein
MPQQAIVLGFYRVLGSDDGRTDVAQEQETADGRVRFSWKKLLDLVAHSQAQLPDAAVA